MDDKKIEGYNIDLFVDTPFSDDICAICKQVCREIVETNCGHPFCKNCLETWIQTNAICPIDREELNTGKYQNSNIARRRIANSKMKCPNDCEEEIQVKNLESHLANTCQERKISCSVCGNEIKAKELKDHMGNAMADHVQALCSKVNKLSENLNSLCENVNSISEKLNNLSEQKENEQKNEFDSNIITQEKKKKFFSLIRRRVSNPQFKLLFRASRDGFASSKFHGSCDNRGPTLTVVSANGKIFGGFNSRSWNGSIGNYEDCHGQSWIFSLDNNTIIINSKGSGCHTQSIYQNSGYGPTFGGAHDLHIASNCNTNTNSYCSLGYSYSAPHLGIVYGGNGVTYLAGNNNFKVTNYEVFAISL